MLRQIVYLVCNCRNGCIVMYSIIFRRALYVRSCFKGTTFTSEDHLVLVKLYKDLQWHIQYIANYGSLTSCHCISAILTSSP